MFQTHKHIKPSQLSCWDKIEGDFNDYYTPCSECAIAVSIPYLSELSKFDYEPWEILLFDELLERGADRGEKIWIEIDY